MPRGIDDLLSTSSDSCFLFSVAFNTDCLSIDRLHVNRHEVLFKHVIELNGGLLSCLSGKNEDAVVLELEDVVVAFVIFIGLMSCLGLPHFLGSVLGSVLDKSVFDHKKHHPEHRNAMETTKVRFDIVALYQRVIGHCWYNYTPKGRRTTHSHQHQRCRKKQNESLDV